MNTLTTTITKDRTMRLYPTDFGFTRKTGYSVGRTRTGNWSIRADGLGKKRINCDGRLEFSVASDTSIDSGDSVMLSWRKRGDSVILSVDSVNSYNIKGL